MSKVVKVDLKSQDCYFNLMTGHCIVESCQCKHPDPVPIQPKKALRLNKKADFTPTIEAPVTPAPAPANSNSGTTQPAKKPLKLKPQSQEFAAPDSNFSNQNTVQNNDLISDLGSFSGGMNQQMNYQQMQNMQNYGNQYNPYGGMMQNQYNNGF
jgi:hypothetical protein